MEKEAKRIGRPVKPVPRKERRARLSLIVGADTKRKLDKSAKDGERSLSAEIEAMIDRCFTYDTMLEAMQKTMAEIVNGNLDAAFRKAGYAPIHSPHGNVWVPPGFPVERSGFIDQENNEQ